MSPAGPPISFRIRLPAVLSLVVTVARQRSATVMPVFTCFSVTGECARRSPFPYRTTRSSSPGSESRALRMTAPHAIALNVDANGNLSSARWPTRRPVPVSTA